MKPMRETTTALATKLLANQIENCVRVQRSRGRKGGTDLESESDGEVVEDDSFLPYADVESWKESSAESDAAPETGPGRVLREVRVRGEEVTCAT